MLRRQLTVKLRAQIDGRPAVLDIEDRAWLAVPRVQLWTLGQIAWVLQVDPRTVRRMVDARPPKLPVCRIMGELRFNPDDVLRTITGCKVGVAGDLPEDPTLWQRLERLTFLLTRRDLRRTNPVELETHWQETRKELAHA